MQASKVRVGGLYVYSPGNSSRFDYWYKYKHYNTESVFKVRVLAVGVERYSKSTGKYINNGIKIEYVDAGRTEEDPTATVTANRLKRAWTDADDDHFKQELLAAKEAKKRRIEQNNKRAQVAALSQYQARVLEEEGVNITDVLEANGLELGTDFSIEKYDRGVTLRGDGIKKLLAILGV